MGRARPGHPRIIDPGEPERCEKDMAMAAEIARRLPISLMRSDAERGDPPTPPPAAA
jgi:hypothetical protein